jgi:acyl-CoA synthetase (NDP forming)
MGLRKADLAQFFSPRSIAIVGVPRKDYRFGGLSYLVKFKEYGFPGRLYPINPNATEILGFKAYPSLQRAARALIHFHRYHSHFISL